MPDPLIPLLDLLVSLQREKAYALRAVQAGAAEAEAAFEMQSTLTAMALEAVELHCPPVKALLPRRFPDSFSLRVNETFRASQTSESLAEWYGLHLESPVQQVLLGQLADDPDLAPAQIGALVHETASLGYLAQLRDIGLSIYARAEITAFDLVKLRAAAGACLARERLFFGLADEAMKRLLDETRGALAHNLEETGDLLRRIKTGQGKALLAETPQRLWAERLEGELTSRSQALRDMIARMKADSSEAAALAMGGPSLDSDVEQALDAIAALPLCRGLSEAGLRALLKGARLMELERNETFMTQGEKTSRFFVVMDGWVKVYKTADDGEESVLQIMGRREALLDNVFVNVGPAAVCGRAVTRVRLLALSLSALRESAARNRELAQNLLAATTARLQKLVAHFEQITLRSAAQRVGWFFVNLHLETGLEGAPLRLPYDKALIASYLNIKPETFSRVLQQFRKDGFKIEKNEIVMPHVKALCAYCDPELAMRCCRAEAFNCAPLRGARTGGDPPAGQAA